MIDNVRTILLVILFTLVVIVFVSAIIFLPSTNEPPRTYRKSRFYPVDEIPVYISY